MDICTSAYLFAHLCIYYLVLSWNDKSWCGRMAPKLKKTTTFRKVS